MSNTFLNSLDIEETKKIIEEQIKKIAFEGYMAVIGAEIAKTTNPNITEEEILAKDQELVDNEAAITNVIAIYARELEMLKTL